MSSFDIDEFLDNFDEIEESLDDYIADVVEQVPEGLEGDFDPDDCGDACKI